MESKKKGNKKTTTSVTKKKVTKSKKKVTNAQKRKKISVKQKPKKVKRRRLRIGRVLLVFLVLFFLFYLLSRLLSFPIRSIFISGNTLLSDQEIIELAHLENYPSYFSYTKGDIRRKLEKNTYIMKAKVTKKRWREIWIEIEENKPLFYDSSAEKTVLKDKTLVEDDAIVPILLNYVPDTIYDLFVTNMAKIEEDVFYRISEIKYDPNDVDEGRFLFTMNDGNYVYVTVRHMDKINHYVDIMKEVLSKYNDEKGILYLDEGEYFKVLE